MSGGVGGQSTQVKDHSHHFGKTRKKTLDM
jgi:hypothetical protein